MPWSCLSHMKCTRHMLGAALPSMSAGCSSTNDPPLMLMAASARTQFSSNLLPISLWWSSQQGAGGTKADGWSAMAVAYECQGVFPWHVSQGGLFCKARSLPCCARCISFSTSAVHPKSQSCWWCTTSRQMTNMSKCDFALSAEMCCLRLPSRSLPQKKCTTKKVEHCRMPGKGEVSCMEVARQIMLTHCIKLADMPIGVSRGFLRLTWLRCTGRRGRLAREGENPVRWTLGST